jgi:four helix bundle protein
VSEKISRFTDLIAWQEAHKLTLLIYKISEEFPNSEKYNLTSQIRRAVVSIESCLAEGFCRYHYKDRLQFYYESRGSLGEVQSQMMDAKDLRFLDEKIYKEVIIQTEKVNVILGGLIRQTQSFVKK